MYVSEGPKRLEEGIEKHVISVFVADESGLINRVAGVFGRRAVNIESLAVGLTADRALFTIVTLGNRLTMVRRVGARRGEWSACGARRSAHCVLPRSPSI